MSNQNHYDLIIIGSGAGGGTLAYKLAPTGKRILILERGDYVPREKDNWSSKAVNLEGKYQTKEKWRDQDGNELHPHTNYYVGGNTKFFGAALFRLRKQDFGEVKHHGGISPAWPISYDDLKPYYDRLDQLVGIFGSNEGIENEPDGVFLPPPKPRCYELKVQKACKGLGIPVIPSRLSILTRPLGGRAACHYCGQCGRGCSTSSNFSTPGVLLPPALATGRLTLVTGAMAREVTTDAEGLATGVSYVETSSGKDRHVRARIVVLAASACESARLLLNSRSSRHPDGLANSSGCVGRYLTDTVGTSVSGFIPSLVDLPPHNEDGVGGMHVYVPWWLDNRTLDFPRGYHVELGGGKRMPGYGFGGGIEQIQGGGMAELAETVRFLHGRQGVEVRDEVEGLFVPLQVNVLADRAKVVAPVEQPGGLDAGKDTHWGGAAVRIRGSGNNDGTGDELAAGDESRFRTGGRTSVVQCADQIGDPRTTFSRQEFVQLPHGFLVTDPVSFFGRLKSPNNRFQQLKPFQPVLVLVDILDHGGRATMLGQNERTPGFLDLLKQIGRLGAEFGYRCYILGELSSHIENLPLEVCLSISITYYKNTLFRVECQF